MFSGGLEVTIHENNKKEGAAAGHEGPLQDARALRVKSENARTKNRLIPAKNSGHTGFGGARDETSRQMFLPGKHVAT